MKILIVNDTEDMGVFYDDAFRTFGEITKNPDELKNSSLVVFTGGEDVHPMLYGEKDSDLCFCNLKRDLQEALICQKALKAGIPMFGICRGAQFLCVMAGGKLVQDTTGHDDNHFITTGEKRFMVSSAHHQMMIPDEKAEILAWADPSLSEMYIVGKDNITNYNKEIEAVKFPSMKAAGIQYHPEIMDEESEGFKYFLELVKSIL